MKRAFQPIAIVGAGCILPGCANVEDLWQTVSTGRTHLTQATEGEWRVPMGDVLSEEPGRQVVDRTWSDIGGYVRGFDALFDPASTRLDAGLVAGLDPVFKWSLYAATQALAGVPGLDAARQRAGVILGNLSYPTRAHSLFAEREWLRRCTGTTPPSTKDVAAMNRFMSGLPAMLVAQGMGFGGGSLALDAACASGLYAVKLACDRLQDGRADLMLAGAVNAADQLFLHVGFSALQALSHSGQSRPFNRDADGLVPAEGAAFVALKRLDDAQAAGDRILGVIRGVGLSNDGRSGGFLSPARAGQERCMRDALTQAGLAAADVQYVECHATGTAVGDATEIASMHAVYGGVSDLPIGSLKANLGHLVTASGVAGLIKVLAAMRHGEVPATPGSRPLAAALGSSTFRVPETSTLWHATAGQRTAAVSSFGFGGNNAHLIVQQAPAGDTPQKPRPAAPPVLADMEFAIVGLGMRTHLDRNADDFAHRLLGDTPMAAASDAPPEEMVSLDVRQLAFPPSDLKQALGQQLILLDVLQDALRGLGTLDPERTGIYVGMQTDSEVCRHGLRWRLPDILARSGSAIGGAALAALQDSVVGPLSAAGVIGKMPNICANRLSNQLDILGPGFTVSREELSGDAALELACSAVRRGEIDAALVGAVDLCREEVHQAAMRGLGLAASGKSADAAVMLALKSREQAECDGDAILAILTPADRAPDAALLTLRNDDASPLEATLGRAHAASGLLHVGLGVQMLRVGACIDTDGQVQPLLAQAAGVRIAVSNTSMFGEQADWLLARASGTLAKTARLSVRRAPLLVTYAADSPSGLLQRVQDGQSGGEGPCRLAIVAAADGITAARAKTAKLLAAGQLGDAWSIDGICYRRAPLSGELAFAFTGAAAAYPGMGRDLLLAMPALSDALATTLRDTEAAAGWAYRTGDERATLPFYQLAGSSFLCQVHTQLSRGVFGLAPTASIGLSSGETNAMFAFGVWHDIGGLLSDVAASNLYSTALAHSFDAVRAHWRGEAGSMVDWTNWRVRVSAERLQAALAGRERVYLTIVNSPVDCVIGGDRVACAALLAALDHPPAIPLGHDLAIHCAAVQPFEAVWRRMHTRPVAPVSGVRFYSNHFGGVFIPTELSVAQALTGQALDSIDFPRIVNQAWDDGVRIFVEHGPRNGLGTALGEILGEREYLAVSLDRAGVPALVQAWRAAAELWCAGVDIDLARLQAFAGDAAMEPALPAEKSAVIDFRLRPPRVALLVAPARPPVPVDAGFDTGARLLGPAPLLSYPAGAAIKVPVAASPPGALPLQVPTRVSPPIPLALPLAEVAAVPTAGNALALLMAAHRSMVAGHGAYMKAQEQTQSAFLASMQKMQALLLGARQLESPRASATVLASSPASTPTPTPDAFPGPSFSRAQLEILAGGAISSVFGPDFEHQDRYAMQVRMPQPPLLLCDRVLGIEGAPHSMGQGTIWTETDVRADSWYLHDGRMPAGVFIESGQADLLLISWLGIDDFNRGERAYRLLGCELAFHGPLPKPGDTLRYEITIDGHARQGEVRLFFFHYDCHVDGELRLSVRNGQAGFFSTRELADSVGVIWSAETANYAEGGCADPSEQATRKTRFTAQDLRAYLRGDLVDCFGEQFYWANTHTRTPRSTAGGHHFLGAVTVLDFAGGPAGRGYLRAETPVTPEDWYFDGHFKNDPCMPGTLMAEACLQAMAFYLAATGHTLRRDGWRFQPVTNQRYAFKCRGQVTPTSKHIVYELFVDEIVDGPMPILYAHVLSTVDGRKAFLCERLGLQLVPDWPLTSMPKYLHQRGDTRPVARIGDLALDYPALIHCAWGQPSNAFGPGFAAYDGVRRSPRLPGPPYHFMTRITALHGKMGDMKPRARVTAVYDIEPGAWYFKDNPGATMPNAVLMEIALQPCGWLASYTLSRAAMESELLFRNLDGESVQAREITASDSTIVTDVELTSVSQVGDLIIEKFTVCCTIEGKQVLRVQTVFGFFPPAAMLNQKGFSVTPLDLARLNADSDIRIDLADRPASLFTGRGSARLPDSMLLMIDRISGYWPQGGAAGIGSIRTEKDVDSRDWFFKAHFFQDPVQPGSLGVEAMLQSIQSWLLLKGLDGGIDNPRFEPVDIGGQTAWHYRGQVTPERTRITVEFEATELGNDTRGTFVIGFARLWVDGLQIYQAPRIGVRVVPGPPVAGPTLHPWHLDLDKPGDAWLRGHCPTYAVPALPFTYALDLMAGAACADFPGRRLVAIDVADAKQWLAFRGNDLAGVTVVQALDGDARETVLQFGAGDGRLVTGATARLRFAAAWPEPDLAPLPPLENAARIVDPYDTCGLFHGPALQLMRELTRGSNGARAIVARGAGNLPRGQLNAALLDAALHCIPHDDFGAWCDKIEPGQAAFPLRIEGLRLFGSLADADEAIVEARFVGLAHERFPVTHVRIAVRDRIVVAFDLREVLLPKGRLGGMSACARRAFLGERHFVPGMALADVGPGQTRLMRADVRRSDWLPGTLAQVYRVALDADLAQAVAVKDHVAAHLRMHPGEVVVDDAGHCLNLPLNRFDITVRTDDNAVMVESQDPAALDTEALARDWRTRMPGEAEFVRDLGLVLIKRFVRRVVIADPRGHGALRGRPVLYLGNHQTAVESFLFLAIVTSLSDLPAGAIAKSEHRDSWIGTIHRLAELAMGDRNPLRMLFFNRADQTDMLRLLQAYGESLAHDPYSLLVHVDGTRARRPGAPVRTVSSVLVDLALKHDLPIVPVRFAGGLGAGEHAERLEFPYRLGRQDYYLGAAIDPDVLRRLPYAQRAVSVAEAINGLGPTGDADLPLAGDVAFAEAVRQGMAAQRTESQAVLLAALRDCMGRYPLQSAAPMVPAQAQLMAILLGRGS